jgi:hypothetical protein
VAGFFADTVVGAEAANAKSVVIHTDPAVFLAILSRTKGALVVMADNGVFRTKYEYLTSYKGLTFHTKSNELLTLPSDVELLTATSISVAEG